MIGTQEQKAEEPDGEPVYVGLSGGSSPQNSNRRWPHPQDHGEQANEAGEPEEEPAE